MRLYLLKNSNFNNNNNFIGEINTDINKFTKDNVKLIKTYNVKKRSFLNINQKVYLYDKKQEIITYSEVYNLVYNTNNKIVMEYNIDILDNDEFPLLYKYDINEEYEEKEYKTKYGNIISNKFETYLEINKEFQNREYYDMI
jgi:hypothetical protein